MPKFTFQLLIALLPCLAFAQRQYLDATVTMNDGRKITGKIAVETWLASPRSIDFKEKGGSLKTYRVVDLSQFEVTRYDGVKQYFSRYTIEIEVSPIRTYHLDNNPALRYQRDTV
jgi:hypothetical protein